jgi:hypothetical protein
MNVTTLRQRILHHIRMAVRLGWSTRLGQAAREFVALLKARLAIVRAAA